MPSVQALQPVTIDDFGLNTLFNGLIILRSDDAGGLAGLSPVQNLAFSVSDGAVVAVHQCDRASVVHKLNLPISIAASSATMRYYGDWIAGDAKALRADLGVSGAIADASIRLNIPNSSTVEVAGLYGYKV